MFYRYLPSQGYICLHVGQIAFSGQCHNSKKKQALKPMDYVYKLGRVSGNKPNFLASFLCQASHRYFTLNGLILFLGRSAFFMYYRF